MKGYIDWPKTAQNLKLLRNDNLNLRQYVCHALKFDEANCSGECEKCKFDMDSSISQIELAQVFGVSAGVIANWETGRTTPSFEELIFYSEICGLGLTQVVVFKEKINF